MDRESGVIIFNLCDYIEKKNKILSDDSKRQHCQNGHQTPKTVIKLTRKDKQLRLFMKSYY